MNICNLRAPSSGFILSGSVSSASSLSEIRIVSAGGIGQKCLKSAVAWCKVELWQELWVSPGFGESIGWKLRFWWNSNCNLAADATKLSLL